MLQQRPNNGMLAPGPAIARGTSANQSMRPRPALPDTNVTSATIEDAYVNFILACNPAVPDDCDTDTLKKAFHAPPKSDSKTFETFRLFELIKELDEKTLKTWAELALKLGVEPPDTDKGQSSQKIQQYAVRLKRWMHSMHIDAFFEYLLGNEHDYWTMIPTHASSVTDVLRDGVAAEDDMALRALIPQIRPRRGRKRPGEGDDTSPSQRPRIDSPTNGDFSAVRTHAPNAPWSAHPDGRNMFVYPQGNMHGTPIAPAPPGGATWASELSQTPLTAHPMTAYPQSAVTPSTRQGFWENEPRSAITPSKPNSLNRRHGAKVVSSAWRSGRPGGTGKTRGRPPINKGDGPFSAFPGDNPPPSFRRPKEMVRFYPSSIPAQTPEETGVAAPPPPPSAPARSLSTPNSAGGSRPARPGRLSLQVPERVGGEVRLATPPPVVMVNGQVTAAQTAAAGAATTVAPAPDFRGTTFTTHAMPPRHGAAEEADDTTNKAELLALFTHSILEATWSDTQGNATAPCTLAEAHALASSIITNLEKTAATKETFLMNLAALAGRQTLMGGGPGLRIRVVERDGEAVVYECAWELRFGGVRGSYSMRERVEGKKDGEGDKDGEGEEDEEDEGSVEYWQKKYMDLVGVVKRKDEEVLRVKGMMVEGL